MHVIYKNSGPLGMVRMLPETERKNYEQSIREEERVRIAREIHDELGQWLTALKIEAFLISKTIHDTAIQGQLSTMVSLINKTARAVERIATELRPDILNDLGLVSALEWQGREFEKRTGVRSRIQSGGNLNL